MDPVKELGLQLAPDWSLWVGWAGRGALWLALGLFVTSVVTWVLSPGRPGLDRFAARSFLVGALGLFGAMGCLAALMLSDQFHFAYVFQHSDRAAPALYKISSLWAGQEGSFLLWSVCAALFGVLAVRHTSVDRRWFTVAYSAVLAGLAGILVFESPFAVDLFEGKPYLPPDGAGLNPTLMNYWIVIHPPTIFLGFGALTVAFAWAFSALVRRDMTSWVQPVRPWAILCTTLLGLGLCMGGFWAYETLGWGGFWAWDPVENTSFVPWALSVALLHGLYVQRARGKWAFANAALAGLGLISFLYGTFLTRSGFLGDTSVHSFAEMDRTALWLLVALGGVATLGFFAVWAWGLRLAMATPAEPDLLPRDGPRLDQSIAIGVWLLVAMGLAAGVGMSVPMLMSISGRAPKVVEEGLYHLVFAWLAPATLAVMAVGPWFTWRGLPMRTVLGRMAFVFSFTMALTGGTMFALHFVPEAFKPEPNAMVSAPFGRGLFLVPWMLALIGLCWFAFISSGWKAVETLRRSPRSAGGFLTHVGLVVAVAGLIVSRGFEQKQQVFVQEGVPASALGYTVQFEGMSKNMLTPDNRIQLSLQGHSGRHVVDPELYYLPREGQDPMAVARPSILGFGWHDLYVAVHPMVFDATAPLDLTPGQSVKIAGGTLTYKGIVREGEAGQAGTVFRADLRLVDEEGAETATQPGMRLRETGGMEIVPSPAGKGLQSMLLRMDAGTRAVTVQLQFDKPLFPVEVFYKPMTVLVWAGTGIMTLGGLLAAWHRRKTIRTATEPRTEPAPAPDDAPQQVAQV